MPNILEMKGKIESLSKIIEDIKAEPKASFRCEKHKKNWKLTGWIKEKNGADRGKSQ